MDDGTTTVSLGFALAATVWWSSWLVQLCYIGFRAMMAPAKPND